MGEPREGICGSIYQQEILYLPSSMFCWGGGELSGSLLASLNKVAGGGREVARRCRWQEGLESCFDCLYQLQVNLAASRCWISEHIHRDSY